jgi:membrane protease YdiL (CAAX protease family)
MVRSVLIYGATTLLSALFVARAGLPSLFSAPFTLERGIISILIAAALAALVVLGGRKLERYDWYRRMADAIRPVARLLLGPKAGMPETFLLALASSIGEETLFRGAVQPGLVLLTARILPPYPALAAAILGTSLTFTLFHPPIFKELRPWTVFAFVFGLALGALAAWSGSLAGPLLAHFLVNFFNLGRLLAHAPVAPPPQRC